MKIGERLARAGVDVSPDLEDLSRLSEDLPGSEKVREVVEIALRSATR